MASSYPRGGTPEEIEREAERTRADIAETLDELQRRLSPAHYKALVMDRASPFWEVIRRHPAPSLVIGVGLLWLAAELAREPGRRRGHPAAAVPPLPRDHAPARFEDVAAPSPVAGGAARYAADHPPAAGQPGAVPRHDDDRVA